MTWYKGLLFIVANIRFEMKKVLILGMFVLLSVVTQSAISDVTTIVEKLSPMMPNLNKEQVSKTPIEGLYQIVLGGQIVYVSNDGRYLLQGEMLDVETRQNLTQSVLDKVRKQAIGKISEDQMIIFKSKNEKHKLTIFSDIDCGYCRKLHAEISDYLKQGITVRYLFMPRSGVNTPSYHKAVSVWCADNRNEALTNAKLGQSTGNKTCDNPVVEHMKVAELLAISGTPAIITESGRLIPGYVPADKILLYLVAE